MSGKNENSSVAGFALLLTAYLALNSSLNLLNKWALGIYGFRFPFLLTSSHMAFSFVMLAPVAMCSPWESHVKTLRQQWRGIVSIGLFMAFNIALNNISLQDISLTLNQVIRSAIPVVTCTLAVVVEGRRPSRKEAISLLILTVGVMITVWRGRATGKFYAIVFCVTATVCNGAMMTFSGKLMSQKLDVVHLTFYTAPVSLAALFPFFFRYELADFRNYGVENGQGAALVLLLTSVNALSYNLVHSMMIKRTSAVTTTVLGMVKIIGLLLLSAMLLGEGRALTFGATVGCAMAIVGFGLYSSAKLADMKRAANVHVISLEAQSSSSSETKPLAENNA